MSQALHSVLTCASCSVTHTVPSLVRPHASHQSRGHTEGWTLVVNVYWILTKHTAVDGWKKGPAQSPAVSLPSPLFSGFSISTSALNPYCPLTHKQLEQKQSRDEVIIPPEHGVNYPSAAGFNTLNRPPGISVCRISTYPSVWPREYQRRIHVSIFLLPPWTRGDRALMSEPDRGRIGCGLTPDSVTAYSGGQSLDATSIMLQSSIFVGARSHPLLWGLWPRSEGNLNYRVFTREDRDGFLM